MVLLADSSIWVSGATLIGGALVGLIAGELGQRLAAKRSRVTTEFNNLRDAYAAFAAALDELRTAASNVDIVSHHFKNSNANTVELLDREMQKAHARLMAAHLPVQTAYMKIVFVDRNIVRIAKCAEFYTLVLKSRPNGLPPLAGGATGEEVEGINRALSNMVPYFFDVANQLRTEEILASGVGFRRMLAQFLINAKQNEPPA